MSSEIQSLSKFGGVLFVLSWADLQDISVGEVVSCCVLVVARDLLDDSHGRFSKNF